MVILKLEKKFVRPQSKNGKDESESDAVSRVVVESSASGFTGLVIADVSADGAKTMPDKAILIISGKPQGSVPIDKDGNVTSLPSDIVPAAQDAGLLPAEEVAPPPQLSEASANVLEKNKAPPVDLSSVRSAIESTSPGVRFNPLSSAQWNWLTTSSMPLFHRNYHVHSRGRVYMTPAGEGVSVGRKNNTLVDDLFQIIQNVCSKTVELYKQPVDFKATSIDIEGVKYEVYMEKGTLFDLSPTLRSVNPGIYRHLISRMKERPFMDVDDDAFFTRNRSKFRYMEMRPFQSRFPLELPIIPPFQDYLIDVHSKVTLYNSFSVPGISIMPPEKPTNRDVLVGELPVIDPDFITNLASAGAEVSREYLRVARRIIDTCVDFNFTSNINQHREITTVLALNASEPDLQDLPGTVTSTDPTELMKHLLMIGMTNIGYITLARSSGPKDVTSVVAELVYKMMTPINSQDPALVADIDNDLVASWLSGFDKPQTGKESDATYVMAAFPGTRPEVEDVYAGYPVRQMSMNAGAADRDSFLETVGDGPIRRIFAMDDLPAMSFPGAPTNIAGMNVVNSTKIPAQWLAMINFLEVLSIARASRRSSNANKMIMALQRMAKTSYEKIKDFSESFLTVMGSLQAMGLGVPQGRRVNTGGAIYTATHSEYLALLMKVSDHSVAINRNIFQCMENGRYLISDLKMMVSFRQWVRHKVIAMLDAVTPFVNGHVAIKRDVMKEGIIKTVAPLNAWLRLPESIHWWSILRELDEVGVEDPHFLDALELVFNDMTAGYHYNNFFRNSVDIGTGQADPPVGFQYITVSDGIGAVIRDKTGDRTLNVYNSKDLHLENFSLPLTITGHPWFVSVNVKIEETFDDTTSEYPISAIVDKISRGDPFTVDVHANNSDVSSLRPSPRQWYSGTLVKVRDSGIVEVTPENLFGDDTAQPIRVILFSRMNHVVPLIRNV